MIDTAPGTPAADPTASLAPEVDTAPLSSSGLEAEVPAKKAYLKAKFRVGSCKGPKNFESQETVFHPDDVPADKRANKMRVKKFLHPEKLVGRADWNTCTTGALEIFSKRTRVNSEFDRPKMYVQFQLFTARRSSSLNTFSPSTLPLFLHLTGMLTTTELKFCPPSRLCT
jgi:hypothetical protein